MKTVVGTDLQASALGNTYGDTNSGSSVTYTTISNTATTSGDVAVGSNVLTFASGPSNFFVGQSLSGTNVPTGAYIVSVNTTAHTVTMSQYVTTKIDTGTTITAASPAVTDTQKAWTTTTGATIKDVPGQWAGKTVIAGSSSAFVSAASATVTVGSGVATLSSAGSAPFTAAMVGGILYTAADTFVVTGYTDTTHLTVSTLTGDGSVSATTNFQISYGVYYGTVLSNTATQLIVDSWKSMQTHTVLSGTPTSFTSGATPAANSGYHIVTGAAPSFYIGLSTDTTTVAGTETSLVSYSNDTNTSEEVANGLQRALATYAHTSNTNTFTLSKTFTYTSSTPKSIAKIGVFNASTGGVMSFATKLPATVPLSTNGDTLTITETVTIN